MGQMGRSRMDWDEGRPDRDEQMQAMRFDSCHGFLWRVSISLLCSCHINVLKKDCPGRRRHRTLQRQPGSWVSHGPLHGTSRLSSTRSLAHTHSPTGHAPALTLLSTLSFDIAAAALSALRPARRCVHARALARSLHADAQLSQSSTSARPRPRSGAGPTSNFLLPLRRKRKRQGPSPSATEVYALCARLASRQIPVEPAAAGRPASRRRPVYRFCTLLPPCARHHRARNLRPSPGTHQCSPPPFLTPLIPGPDEPRGLALEGRHRHVAELNLLKYRDHSLKKQRLGRAGTGKACPA